MESICAAMADTPQRRKPKKKKTKKNGSMESREMDLKLKTCKKRKSSETLKEEGVGVTSSYFDKPVSFVGPSVNISSDSVRHVNPKRAKTASDAAVASLPDTWDVDSGFSSEISPSTSGRSSPCVGINPSMLVAVDCEMVGTGPGGKYSELARCSLINYYGTVIYDKYILPRLPVTDYRTRWSGITKKHLKGALSFEEARNEILHILKGKVIIGHALHNDFRAMGITVPRHMVRDTSCMKLLRQMCGSSEKEMSLKRLSSVLLKRNIQVGQQGHCSIEDSRAALDLYKLVEDQWEKSLQAHQPSAL
uniref:Exonuclease domain-containing protein n=1 Tax=Electrophorus electricus TaxID=8005 RepID=A0A4W4H7K6_ELEEL